MIRLAICLAVLLPLSLPSRAQAQAPMLPYETCNKGMAPAPCMCADARMVESFMYTTRRQKTEWERVGTLHLANFGDAQKEFAKARITDSLVTGAMSSCASGDVELGLSNFFNPVYNSCYCETTCDVLVTSTRVHEQTHSSDHAAAALTVAYVFGMAPVNALIQGNELLTALGVASEVHAHDEQAKYLETQVQKFLDQGCTWQPVTPPPPPSPPPPSGFVPRIKALARAAAGSGSGR